MERVVEYNWYDVELPFPFTPDKYKMVKWFNDDLLVTCTYCSYDNILFILNQN